MQQKSLGQKIYDLRTQHGYSQETLGNLIGVSRQSISKWELDTASPNADNIIELCKLFSVSADYLLGAEENLHQIEKNNDEVVATTSPDSQESKPNKKAKVFKIICWSLLGVFFAFVAVVLGFIYFTPNQGMGQTTHTITFGDDMKYVWFIGVIVVVVLIGIKLYTVIKKK